jgi:hypothetical protein
MITDKVITIPTIDTIINHEVKKCNLSRKLVVATCILIFVLVNISNSSLDYGYHELITNHPNHYFYGGSETYLLGLSDDQLYYKKVNYLGSEYQSTIISSLNLKNGKYQTIYETKARKVMMFNEYLVYQDSDRSISAFNTLDKTESSLTYDHQIDDLEIILGNLIVTCNNENSLIYVYNNLDQSPQQYQLNIQIDNVIFYDNTKVIYSANNELSIYDINSNKYQSLSSRIEKLVHGYIDKLVFYNDRLLFSLDNSNSNVYSYDLNTSALRLVADKFTNKSISSWVVNDNDLYIAAFDGDSYLYRLNDLNQLEHIKTIDNDRIWSIIFDNEKYLLELDNGYYLGRINKLSQKSFLP